MESMANLSQEEFKELLEKAKREAQAALDRMTPEERAQAEMKAAKLIEEDRAAMQSLYDQAVKAAAGFPQKETTAPKFCTNCGAPVSGGKFCTNCGSPLYHVD